METTITAKKDRSTMRGAAAIAHILQKEGIEVLTVHHTLGAGSEPVSQELRKTRSGVMRGTGN